MFIVIESNRQAPQRGAMSRARKAHCAPLGRLSLLLPMTINIRPPPGGKPLASARSFSMGILVKKYGSERVSVLPGATNPSQTLPVYWTE